MNGYYQQVIEVLTRYGFSLVRHGKGSHELWGKGSRTVTVSRNCESRHTANSIMKQAGISHKF